MSRTTNFVQKRRGILDHLQEGRLTLLEYAAHDVMLLKADKATGVWFGSAKALACTCGAGDLTDRQARHVLESLESKSYIRRFPTRRSHANYPILIHRYEVTFGAYTGMRLNAWASSNWRQPAYENCLEQGAGQGAENAPYQEERKDKRETKTCANPNGSHDGVPAESVDCTEYAAAVRRVWDYYIHNLDKNPKLLTFSSLRKQKGIARLRECLAKTGNDLQKAEALMRLAIDALAASGFHRGENDRNRRYDSWEKNLFVNQEKMECWLEQS
jgi:hypothetical protein